MDNFYLKYFFPVLILLVLAYFLVKFLLKFTIKYVRKYVSLLRFRWYFSFFPEPEKEKELRKLQLKTCIVPELKTLAKLLNVGYEKENQNLTIISKVEHGSVNDFKGMRENLIKIRKEINKSRRDFYTARYTAELFGFVVSKEFKDYLM